jgi:hypothetical protein
MIKLKDIKLKKTEMLLLAAGLLIIGIGVSFYFSPPQAIGNSSFTDSGYS